MKKSTFCQDSVEAENKSEEVLECPTYNYMLKRGRLKQYPESQMYVTRMPDCNLCATLNLLLSGEELADVNLSFPEWKVNKMEEILKNDETTCKHF